MGPFHIRTGALLAVGIILTATPSFAQRDGRRHGDERARRESVERAQPRRSGEPRGRAESQERVEPRRAESRGRVESQRWAEARGRVESRGWVDPYRGHDNRTYGGRAYDNRLFGDRPYNYRSYGHRSYGHRSYGYHPYVNRSYVLPYGYRPYGYRPGWSLNFYFGRPYDAYDYLAYGYPSAGYGYYAFAPGRAYGAVRIVDAPRDAQVFVDGYYAGVVDDYDGVFQHLSLEAGSHHIEIEAEGYPPIAFDVRVAPGQTITYRANIR